MVFAPTRWIAIACLNKADTRESVVPIISIPPPHKSQEILAQSL